MNEQFIAQCNVWGKEEIPFLFIIDFEKEKPLLCKIEDAADQGIWYNIRGTTNHESPKHIDPPSSLLLKHPLTFEQYLESFRLVQKHLHHGDSYLVNLTFPTPINTSLSLDEIYELAQAPYKIRLKDQFICFSPERFIKIEDNRISSNPMKGTIDATLAHAATTILANTKEHWEHNTIVDLIRNDLSMVSTQVQVLRYRYLDYLKSLEGSLLQVSSEIQGKLPPDWKTKIGTILNELLPAGSISGAPKKKTLEIIKEAEGTKRGYYTGIFGHFDGKELDSAVSIRYIESINNMLQFRSGGGITINSNAEQEYLELIAKVNVPTL